MQVHDICRHQESGRTQGLLILAVIINNGANTTLGGLHHRQTDAGYEFSRGSNPVGGTDTNGLTAMLNSLVKLDPAIHAGAVQNIRLSPEWFRNNAAAVKSILKTYFEKGGTQAMITVVNKYDLEKAMLEPEKYGHIFVRVGGFSARFAELVKCAAGDKAEPV